MTFTGAAFYGFAPSVNTSTEVPGYCRAAAGPPAGRGPPGTLPTLSECPLPSVSPT